MGVLRLSLVEVEVLEWASDCNAAAGNDRKHWLGEMLFTYKMEEKLLLINFFLPDLCIEGNKKQHNYVPGKHAET